jgi:hyperosmotically inducible periplasmic protein
MVLPHKTRSALTVLSLAAVFTVPAFPQSTSNTGGGVQATSKTSSQDKQVAQQVYDRLKADQVDYYKHVTVSAENGVVTLGGTVATTEALNKAKKIASEVPGVTRVSDQMTVERAPNHPRG